MVTLETDRWEFYVGPKVISGFGCSDKLDQEVEEYPVKKVMVVIDEAISNLERVSEILNVLENGEREITIYNKKSREPTIEDVETVYNLIREKECELLVAIGGGSTIDTAKMAGVLITNGGELSDYLWPSQIPNDPLPLIALPTTVGTGSEMNIGAVVTDEEADKKMIFAAENIAPEKAVLDPSLLTTLPSKVVAATAFDALVQGVESYLSRNSMPYTDALSLAAIRIIADNIRAAVADSGNIPALANMQVASNMVGTAFCNAGTGADHAIANTLGGKFKVPHGILCAILLPHVMRYNFIARKDKFTCLAQALGEDVSSLSAKQASKVAIQAIADLLSDLDIPKTLTEVGVNLDEKGVSQVAKEAMETPDMDANPRIPNTSEIEEVIKKAL